MEINLSILTFVSLATKKRTVIDHEWIFFESSKQQSSQYIEAGTYTYPFELLLPGHLPETIEDSSYGQIFYKLKAVAIRSGLTPKLIAREILYVYRQPTITSVDVTNDDGDRRSSSSTRGSNSDTRSIRVSGQHENILTYELECRQKIFRRGDRVSVKIHLWPHNNSNDDEENEELSSCRWSIRSISCVLKEITTFDDTMASSLNRDDKVTETRILRFIKEEEFPSFIENHYQKSIRIPIPRYTKYDTTNTLLNIVHHVQLTISLANKIDGCSSELRVVLPIIVVHDELVEALQLAEGDLLPSYEDARRSAPFIPMGEEGILQQDGPSLPSPQNTPINTPIDELDDWLSLPMVCEGPPPLYDIILPSYDTAIFHTRPQIA
ncbi:hypothetical protein BDA99DRAFT_175194 [Phascolomyces articulosus]|uniref:Arrestin C-terminal-like domain-containing protein n=1 Tax=Phascolomyces articulosus TaxID=60185 RepID=A0AAD5K2I8_9FUNG|nr:hypothetical protein BDA99DRAFT_175194 [Phascolomyces articulosus]